ncbi:hypothetical protein GF367_02270 [Candidatus Woesearchaeota archaeon]|nr:hypothetical protein [Candidatus Woesearchaeota archaeon]
MPLGADKGPGIEDWDETQVPMIRYKGVFDWEGLYRLCRLWIEDNRYKFQEKRYKHKGDELEIDLTGERRIDEMHKQHLYVYFHIWHLRDIEIAEGTKTLKRNTGLVHVEIWGSIEVDYSGRFEGSKFKEKLKKWWMIIRKKEFLGTYIEPFTKTLFDLHTKIKTFLNMSTDENYYKL